MQENFHICYMDVLHTEGGYVDDPDDPGGATNEGVTQQVYDTWRHKHSLPPRDVKLLDPNECEALYHEDYWNLVGGDNLSSGLDYCIFDFGVNSGTARASRFLQQVLDVPVDGHIGDVTLKAMQQRDVKELIVEVCNARRTFLRTRQTYWKFGRGWEARVSQVQAESELLI